jgi:hypothetical protein
MVDFESGGRVCEFYSPTWGPEHAERPAKAHARLGKRTGGGTWASFVLHRHFGGVQFGHFWVRGLVIFHRPAALVCMLRKPWLLWRKRHQHPHTFQPTSG